MKELGAYVDDNSLRNNNFEISNVSLRCGLDVRVDFQTERLRISITFTIRFCDDDDCSKPRL